MHNFPAHLHLYNELGSSAELSFTMCHTCITSWTAPARMAHAPAAAGGVQCTFLLQCGYCELRSLLRFIWAGLEPAAWPIPPVCFIMRAFTVRVCDQQGKSVIQGQRMVRVPPSTSYWQAYESLELVRFKLLTVRLLTFASTPEKDAYELHDFNVTIEDNEAMLTSMHVL